MDGWMDGWIYRPLFLLHLSHSAMCITCLLFLAFEITPKEVEGRRRREAMEGGLGR